MLVYPSDGSGGSQEIVIELSLFLGIFVKFLTGPGTTYVCMLHVYKYVHTCG